MRVLVLGGDGFCGWPTSLHLSAGHDVTIATSQSSTDSGTVWNATCRNGT